MTDPSSKSSPPHTPQGSCRERAAAKHCVWTGQPAQRDLAMAVSAIFSEKKSSGSALWQGRVNAIGEPYGAVISPNPILFPSSAQPGTNNSLNRTVTVLTSIYWSPSALLSLIYLGLLYVGKEKGPESIWIRGPWGPISVLADRAPSGRRTKCVIPSGALCCMIAARLV
jgi:hypothetical protein